MRSRRNIFARRSSDDYKVEARDCTLRASHFHLLFLFLLATAIYVRVHGLRALPPKIMCIMRWRKGRWRSRMWAVGPTRCSMDGSNGGTSDSYIYIYIYIERERDSYMYRFIRSIVDRTLINDRHVDT